MTRLLRLASIAALLLAAGGTEGMAADGAVPLPVLPAAKGEACVAPLADMRRNHAAYLEHARDETARRGIRGRRFSLRKCVICHAAPDTAAGGAATVRLFCEACHAYAAVRIDCFQCHTAKPEPAATGFRFEGRGDADGSIALLRAHMGAAGDAP